MKEIRAFIHGERHAMNPECRKYRSEMKITYLYIIIWINSTMAETEMNLIDKNVQSQLLMDKYPMLFPQPHDPNYDVDIDTIKKTNLQDQEQVIEPNQFITHFYRFKQTPDESFISIFRLHNEAGKYIIWAIECA